ncbi:MAG: PBP1A family penicillin-binding protein, partial [Hyphomonadaceae bacterium]
MAEPQDPKPPPQQGNPEETAHSPATGAGAPGSPSPGDDQDDAEKAAAAAAEAAGEAREAEPEAESWGLDPSLILSVGNDPPAAQRVAEEAAFPASSEPLTEPRPEATLEFDTKHGAEPAPLEAAEAAPATPEPAPEPPPAPEITAQTEPEGDAEPLSAESAPAEAEVLMVVEDTAELAAPETPPETAAALSGPAPSEPEPEPSEPEPAHAEASTSPAPHESEPLEPAASTPNAAHEEPADTELFESDATAADDAETQEETADASAELFMAASEEQPGQPDELEALAEPEPTEAAPAPTPDPEPVEPDAMPVAVTEHAAPSQEEAPHEEPILVAASMAPPAPPADEIVVSPLKPESEEPPPEKPAGGGGAGAAVQAALTAFFAKLAAQIDRLRALKLPGPRVDRPERPGVDWEKLRPKLTFRARPPSFKRILILSGWMMAAFVAVIVGFFFYVTWDMPSTRSLWTADNSPSLTFVDRHGRVIIREGAENAPPVDLSKLKRYVPEAIIAIEDRRFYDHFGIDVSGLTRALATNLKAGHVVQGGSTITQQLAKNLFLKNERTFRRKAQEIALALWLESQFSKREILALYMSRVYFGAGAYGIQAAAERYFDKPAKDLTLAEAALLAGLVKAPSKLNPAAQDTAAKNRAKIVLDEMLAAGFITSKQRDEALRAPLSISRTNPNGNLGYFRNWIDPQLTQILGDQRDDFIVETTLDLEAQRAGEQSIDTVIARESEVRHVTQAALLGMDSTGGVTAMIGGLGYGKGEGQSEFNRTTQSLRAPGSSFKYFIYLAAMAKGYTPWMIRVDEPVTIGDWSPGNYEDKYYGAVTLATAYAKSLNMVAIRLANEVGGDAVIDAAHKLGVGKNLANYRSLALGAQGMTLMEMVTGYGAMASGGVRLQPHGIERVRRSNGQVLWQRRAPPAEHVIDDRTLRMMNLLGQSVVQYGTGTRAQLPGRQTAGKTGTSNDYRDAWFIGYTPGMVAGVWVG